MGEPAWALEPSLRDPLERGRRGAHINEHLRAWARDQKVLDVVTRGQALGVPLAKYAEPTEILQSEQTRVRDMFVQVKVPGGDNVPVLAAPFQFTRPEEMNFCAISPGTDNRRILCEWLGHADAEFAQWATEGAL